MPSVLGVVGKGSPSCPGKKNFYKKKSFTRPSFLGRAPRDYDVPDYQSIWSVTYVRAIGSSVTVVTVLTGFDF